MPDLKTRPPTGLPAIPTVIVHGPSKSGRTVAVAKLSTSPLVDRFFVAQIGTQAWDDYGAYFPKVELLDHSGTVSSVLDQIEAACEVKAAAGRLNVIVLDEGTEHWDTHKVLAETRQRRNKRTQAALKDDADAEIDPTMDKWNDVKAKWARMFYLTKRAGVLFVIIARGEEVALVDSSGNPVAGRTVYRPEVEKSTVSRCTMSLRVYPDHRVVLEAVTSIRPEVLDALRTAGKTGLVLPDDNPVASAIELVAGDKGWTDGSKIVVGHGDTHPTAHAKVWTLDTIRTMVPTFAEDIPALKLAGASLWSAVWDTVAAPSGDEMTADQLAHLQARVPVLVLERFLSPGEAPAAEPTPIGEAPDDSAPETTVPDGDRPTLCPECGNAWHIGACPTPPAAAAPARARVGARAERPGSYPPHEHEVGDNGPDEYGAAGPAELGI